MARPHSKGEGLLLMLEPKGKGKKGGPSPEAEPDFDEGDADLSPKAMAADVVVGGDATKRQALLDLIEMCVSGYGGEDED